MQVYALQHWRHNYCYCYYSICSANVCRVVFCTGAIANGNSGGIKAGRGKYQYNIIVVIIINVIRVIVIIIIIGIIITSPQAGRGKYQYRVINGDCKL